MNWGAPLQSKPTSTVSEPFRFYDPSTKSSQDASSSIINISNNDGNYETEEDSDDEYEPIAISGWGDNATETEEQEITWDALVDSSIKIKPGGVGSGGLHRRGINFKPVSEEYIVAQRLKKLVPKLSSGSLGSATRKKKKKKLDTPTVHNISSSKSKNRKMQSNFKPTTTPPIFKTSHPVNQRPPPPSNGPGGSTWGSKPLLETPFWKLKKEKPAPIVETFSSWGEQKGTSTVLMETPFWEQKVEVQTVIEQPVKPLIQTHAEPFVESFVETFSQLNINTNDRIQPQESTTESYKSVKQSSNNWNVNASGFVPSAKAHASNASIQETSKSKWNPAAPGFVPSFALAKIDKPVWNPSVPEFTPSLMAHNSIPVISKTKIVISKPPLSDESKERHSRINTDLPHLQRLLKTPSIPVSKPLLDDQENSVVTPFTVSTSTSTASNTSSATTSATNTSDSVTNGNTSWSSCSTNNKPTTNATTATSNTPTTPSTPTQMTVMKGLLDSQTGPETTNGLESPYSILQVDIELAPGISIKINLYRDSIPEQVVEAFSIKHHISMTKDAKARLSTTLSILLDKKLQVLGALGF